MLINSRQLLGLPVFTKSRQPLGRLSSIDIDSETGVLSILHVATNRIVPRLVEDELLIAWSAVIEITGNEIVVMDNAVKERIGAIARFTKQATQGAALAKDEGYADADVA